VSFFKMYSILFNNDSLLQIFRFPGYFKPLLFQTFFHFPWDFEIAGFILLEPWGNGPCVLKASQVKCQLTLHRQLNWHFIYTWSTSQFRVAWESTNFLFLMWVSRHSAIWSSVIQDVDWVLIRMSSEILLAGQSRM